MKWKQPKVGFAILALLTVGTLALAYKHNIDYQRYVQETTKEYVDLGINPDFLELWSWHVWGIGGFVTFLVIMTVALWMVAAAIWLEGRRKPRVTPSEARHRLALSEGQKENRKRRGENGKD